MCFVCENQDKTFRRGNSSHTTRREERICDCSSWGFARILHARAIVCNQTRQFLFLRLWNLLSQVDICLSHPIPSCRDSQWRIGDSESLSKLYMCSFREKSVNACTVKKMRFRSHPNSLMCVPSEASKLRSQRQRLTDNRDFATHARRCLPPCARETRLENRIRGSAHG